MLSKLIIAIFFSNLILNAANAYNGVGSIRKAFESVSGNF